MTNAPPRHSRRDSAHPQPQEGSRTASPFWQRPGVRLAGLVLIVLLVYSPVFQAGFGWDDDVMLTANSHVQGGWNGLHDIWLSTKLPDYFPLTSTSLWLEWRLWGMNPTGYHITNLLLHVLTALLWWRVFQRLGVPGPWLAALLFAIHPVNVQAVAWIAERKDALSLFLYTLSLVLYLGFDSALQPGTLASESHRPRPGAFRYAGSVLAFLFALLSKTSVVMLPFVLLGLAWWRRGRITRKDYSRMLPFFALAFGMSLVTIWFQYNRSIGSDVVNLSTWPARLAIAGWNICFYLYKAVLPLNLAFIYPRWSINPSNLLCFVPDVGLLVLFALLWWKRRTWGRLCLLGLGYYVLSLLPVLGFLNIYFHRFSFVADHYQYVAIPGLLALVVSGLYVLQRHRRQALPLLAAALVLALGILTWKQCNLYRDTETLWSDTLKKNPRCWLAHNELGGAFVGKEKLKEAEQEYLRAVELNPTAQTCHSLGGLYAERREFEKAFQYFTQSLTLDARNPETHNDFATALLECGRMEEAQGHLREALRLRPGHIVAALRLATLLLQSGRPQEALTVLDKARQHYPAEPSLCLKTGIALAALGRTTEAIEYYRAALRQNPGEFEALNNLAWVLATHPSAQVRNGSEAVELAQRACSPGCPDPVSALDTLAAAYAEAGRFGDATNAIANAIVLAETSGRTNALPGFRSRQELYRLQHAYHQ